MRAHTEYCLGFLFTNSHVALIRKSKPAWQAGLLNGVGGKIEDGERPHEAMVREFQEETGAIIPDWNHIGNLYGTAFTVYCFNARVPAPVILKSITPEPVGWYPATLLPNDVIPNLRWLVPLAFDYLNNPNGPKRLDANYA